MTYRSIFLHLDDSESGQHTVACAVATAKAFDAELAGTYLVPRPPITPFTSAMLPDLVVRSRLADSGQAQDQAEARLRAAATQHGLASAPFAAPAGEAFEQAVLRARHADLAILGQPQAGAAEAEFTSRLAHAVLLDSGRPVILVPYIGCNATAGGVALVAWKETREAARAVADALPFLKKARRVVVVMVTEPNADDGAVASSASGVVHYLAHHGVKAEMRREVADDIDAANLLLSRASDLGADLLVMGGYSRARIAQRVFGGVTRTILETMTVPVLMSH